jgi:hypothetical protein
MINRKDRAVTHDELKGVDVAVWVMEVGQRA